VQNAHSASKKSQPRACRPFPSVNSDVSEIMGLWDRHSCLSPFSSLTRHSPLLLCLFSRSPLSSPAK
jgi:hypothetical protein